MLDWLYLGPAKLVALSALSTCGFGFALIAAHALQRWLTNRTESAPPADQADMPPQRSFFRHPAVFAGLLWLIYVPYELQMGAAYFHRYGADGGAALRWDMLILTPILWGLTGLAIWSLWADWRRRLP